MKFELNLKKIIKICFSEHFKATVIGLFMLTMGHVTSQVKGKLIVRNP